MLIQDGGRFRQVGVEGARGRARASDAKKLKLDETYYALFYLFVTTRAVPRGPGPALTHSPSPAAALITREPPPAPWPAALRLSQQLTLISWLTVHPS